MSQQTNDVIEKLVATHRAITPLRVRPVLLLAMLLLAVVALFLLSPIGLRHEWHAAAWLKSTGLIGLTITVCLFTILLSSPAFLSWRQGVMAFGVGVLSLGVLGLLAKQGSALSFLQALNVPSFWLCVSWITVVGSGAAALLQRLLRRAKPAHRSVFRVLVPLNAALLAAAVYSLHCAVDALTYLLTAYLLAALIVVALSWWRSRRLWCW